MMKGKRVGFCPPNRSQSVVDVHSRAGCLGVFTLSYFWDSSFVLFALR
jgi:hypothetical protein